MGQQKPRNNKEVIDPVEQKALKDAMDNFYKNRTGVDEHQVINPVNDLHGKSVTHQPPMQYQPLANQPNPQTVIPAPQPVTMSGFQNPEDFEKKIYQQQMANVDPNLTVGYEIVPFPSKGLLYPNKISEVMVEYMTSKDEDILSTSSLIENGTVLDILIKNKLKTQGINTDELLVGDRNAILLFLRASSYGQDYEVKVTDPRNGNSFNSSVDLTKLKAKEINVQPDARGEFSLELPVSKCIVKFKILNYKEVNHVLKNAEARQGAYGTPYNEFGSLKLKAEITEINGSRDKEYINQFVDAMRAKDSAVLKQKVAEVTPDVDMNYEFEAPDGYKFKAKISVGVDFFFPFI